MIPFAQISSQETVFSRKDLTGKAYNVAIDRLRYRMRFAKTSPIEVDEVITNILIDNNHVNKEHVNNLISMDEKEFLGLAPMIVIKFKDGTPVIAWGENIYVAAFFRGFRVTKAVVCDRQEWAPFIIKGYKNSKEILQEVEKTMEMSRAIRALAPETPNESSVNP